MENLSAPLLGLICVLFVLWVIWGPRKWLSCYGDVHKVVASGGYGFAIWGIWSFARGLWAKPPTPLAVPPPAESVDFVPAKDFRALEVLLRARDQEILQLRKKQDAKVGQLNDTIRLYQRGVVSGPGPIRQLIDERAAAVNRAQGLQVQVKILEEEGEVLKTRFPHTHARWEHPVKSGVSKQRDRQSTKRVLSPSNQVAVVDSMWSARCTAIQEKGLKDLNLMSNRVQCLETDKKDLCKSNSALKNEVEENVSLRWYQEGVLQKAHAGNKEKDLTIQHLLTTARQQNMVLTHQIEGLQVQHEMTTVQTLNNEIENSRLSLLKAHESALASLKSEHERKESHTIRAHEAEIADLIRHHKEQTLCLEDKLIQKQAQESNAQVQMDVMTHLFNNQTLKSEKDTQTETRKHDMEKVALRAQVKGLAADAASYKSKFRDSREEYDKLKAANEELLDRIALNLSADTDDEDSVNKLDKVKDLEKLLEQAEDRIVESRVQNIELRDQLRAAEKAQGITKSGSGGITRPTLAMEQSPAIASMPKRSPPNFTVVWKQSNKSESPRRMQIN
ncbi:hypothetical protein N7508_001205 [Penicillium antarcticum]|uniref:uncharacterized protein n=1 Tax=Penicillium antarcticum TaxID=416450 RepID=UPI0023907FA9|nr:uncharacterized protein N7508_001205 [Penicillium antarcticum]KAJ5316697.1 hypothetical protein N7508_001205 [Penicillium antarcticum]